jgi:Domain of unknown function (DUF4249)
MYKTIIISAFALTFASCQKVIDVDLNSASPQYVIEGLLASGTDTFKVHIAQTSSYFNAENASTINAAQVTLTRDNGSPLTLQSIGNGDYIAPNYAAQTEHTYTLKVVDNGKTFVAAAYMPRLVQPDTVIVAKPGFVPPGPGGNNDGKKDFIVTTKYKDPAGIANYYRAILRPISATGRNAGYDLQDDKNVDGAPNSITVYGRYLPNTVGSIEFICLDKSTYNYYYQLDDVLSNSNNSVSPANPDNNWSNGALGYFGAAASVKIPIVIQ